VVKVVKKELFDSSTGAERYGGEGSCYYGRCGDGFCSRYIFTL